MLDDAKTPRKGLSELEQQIMDILWRQGRGTAEQVRAALAPRHSLKDSTVRTMLLRLQQKGYVQYERQGRAFLYSGVILPENVAARAVRQILDKFCHGSLEQLLVGLVENEVVDPAELQQLARKLAKKGPVKK